VIEDTSAPTVTIQVPEVVPLRFWVSWLGQDAASGLRDYDVQYKVGITGTWTSWLTHTSQTQAPFVGEAGQSYFFQVRATDNVNNTSAWVEAGPVTVSAVTKYYYHGDQRVAMRQGDVVYFIHSDHLGSTSLTTDITGTLVAETCYLPYGEERWITGTLVTDFTFTGQRAERGFALMDYNARYYDPGLGRFVSADTVVPNPGESKDLNRYAYAGNNPVRYTDPTGHYLFEEEPDDPFIWRWDKPGDTNTLIRSAEPVVFWEESRGTAPSALRFLQRPDASVHSIGFSAGILKSYAYVSLDVVSTKRGDVMAFMTVPDSELLSFLPSTRNIGQARQWLMRESDDVFPLYTPQAGIFAMQGWAWGQPFEEVGVKEAYQGPFLTAGGGGGPVTGNAFIAFDRDTDQPSTNVFGFEGGVCYSVPLIRRVRLA
jgi:RHS repeat-associated protein